MILKCFHFGLILYLQYHIIHCKSETVRITYFSIEHPVISYVDMKYCTNFTMISKRISRQDPRHYVEIYINTLIKLDNKLQMDFYFYQFLTNRYRPSFVEMHFKLCDMINTDFFFGEPMRNALGGRFCPYPPGAYHFKNLSIPYVPKGFPFTKGRIYLNASLNEGGVSKIIGQGYVDMEVRVGKIKKN